MTRRFTADPCYAWASWPDGIDGLLLVTHLVNTARAYVLASPEESSALVGAFVGTRRMAFSLRRSPHDAPVPNRHYIIASMPPVKLSPSPTVASGPAKQMPGVATTSST